MEIEVAERPADADDVFSKQMVALIPSLRAFARGLCRDRTLADDLVQEAMMRAWGSRGTYQEGTNFRAWMYTILRNHFYNTLAKNSRLTSFDPEMGERLLIQEPTQEHGINVSDVNKAMALLPPQQREMLLLIAGAGMSYDEAAVVAGCGMGTVKSRLNRARRAIRAIVEGGEEPSGSLADLRL